MRTRWATLWDIPHALGFVIANAVKGALDHRIFTYPTIRVMCAEDDAGNMIAVLPVHTGIILESLGWADGLDAGEKALAAVTALEEIEREAYLMGCREVFFIRSDERTDEFCEKQLGFERVTAMRRRLTP